MDERRTTMRTREEEGGGRRRRNEGVAISSEPPGPSGTLYPCKQGVFQSYRPQNPVSDLTFRGGSEFEVKNCIAPQNIAKTWKFQEKILQEGGGGQRATPT